MVKVSQLVGMAKVFLPANSPWLQRIEQAAEMAKQFSPSKDGIAELMAQQGKSRRDLQSAIKMLDNPVVKNTLGRVPGLNKMIRGAANELSNDSNFNDNDSSFQTPQNQNIGNDGVSDLMARFKRLK